MTGQPSIAQALLFAAKAHADHERKGGGPYIDHCIEVAVLMAASDDASPVMICACLLHDTVEDCEGRVTLDDIEDRFGEEVRVAVDWMTDRHTPEAYAHLPKKERPNREVRKAREATRYVNAPPRIATAKCCDLISNTRTIVKLDPGFARRYMREKQALVDILRHCNPDPAILARVETYLECYFNWIETPKETA